MPTEQAKQDIQSFHQNFPAEFKTDGEGRRVLVPTLSITEQKVQAKVKDLHERMAQIGNRPATVLWLRPFSFRPQGIHTGNYPIPACPIGSAEFKGDGCSTVIRDKHGNALAVKTIIPSYSVDRFVTEFGEWDVREVLAISMAQDIKSQTNSQKSIGADQNRRGVIVYMGDRDPMNYVPDPYNPEKRNLMAELDAETKAMIEEFKQMVQYANDEYVKQNGIGRRNITDEHRIAARYLLHYRLLPKQPEWLLDTRKSEDVQELCGNCKAEPAKGALQCRSCFNWLRPAEAYAQGYLTLSDPNGVIALQRLSRQELEALDLYPTLRPFSELNAERLAEMSGKKKRGGGSTSAEV